MEGSQLEGFHCSLKCGITSRLIVHKISVWLENVITFSGRSRNLEGGVLKYVTLSARRKFLTCHAHFSASASIATFAATFSDLLATLLGQGECARYFISQGGFDAGAA